MTTSSLSHLLPTDNLSAVDLSVIGRPPCLRGHTVSSMVSTDTLSSLALSALSQASAISSPISNRVPLAQPDRVGEGEQKKRAPNWQNCKIVEHTRGRFVPQPELDVLSRDSTDNHRVLHTNQYLHHATGVMKQKKYTDDRTFH